MLLRPRQRGGHEAAQHRDTDRTEQQNFREYQDLPPPRFWDNLFHIPLVKRALRELDRRNSTCQRRGQSSDSPSRSPRDLHQLETGIKYQDLKCFSRTGGPDLSDLRGERPFKWFLTRLSCNSKMFFFADSLTVVSNFTFLSLPLILQYMVCTSTYPISIVKRATGSTSSSFGYAQTRPNPARPHPCVRTWKTSAPRRQ